MPVVLVSVIAAGVLLARTIHRQAWRSSGWAWRVHVCIGWTLVVLGVVHVAATFAYFTTFSGAALWFASGGLAMALAGALNVLQRLYAVAAPGISLASISGNAGMTALAIAFVVLGGGRAMSQPQYLLLLSLLLAGTWLSLDAARFRRSNL